jgi:hypothetical protein
MEDTRWDHALKVAGGGAGLVGHVGAVLPRKAADQAGLTAGLGAALRKTRTSPVLDRGIVLVSVAAAIALGATSMSDIAVLARLAPVLGDAPSGPTLRRTLDLAGHAAMLDRIARAPAMAGARVWALIDGTAAGFPWLAIAGKTLTGWLVIDLDATLVTQRHERRHTQARSEPVRARAPGTPGTTTRPPRQPNRHHTRNRAPAQSGTGPQGAERLRTGPQTVARTLHTVMTMAIRLLLVSGANFAWIRFKTSVEN